MKRKFQASQAVRGTEAASHLCFTNKQLRSRLPRRRRCRYTPIILFSATAQGRTSRTRQASEISCDSSIASVNDCRNAVTAVYCRKRNRNSKVELPEEVSENSCVDSRKLKLTSESVDEEVEVGEVSEFEASGVSGCFSENASTVDDGNLKQCRKSDGITSDLVIPCGLPPEIANYSTLTDHIADNSMVTESISFNSNYGEMTLEVSENRACEEVRSDRISTISEVQAVDIDLACSEQFSHCGVLDACEEEEHDSSSEIYQVVTDLELESSDYASSLWSYTSGSQFSEKSIGDEKCSPTFQLLNQYKQQFCRSTFACDACEDYNSNEITLLGLEVEVEENYMMIRRRERRRAYLCDYAEEYCSTTESGNLIIQQRQNMVHWIVEQATNKELQKETMFLGVSLLDRFLSKGYFKSTRTLQIAGIACLTLASRIEENQPYNCIRRRTFDVGNNTYGRCEVVAMEWLVQEVLEFQCFLPTLYNFLWFYIKAARANERVEKTAKYLAVLTLLGHQQLCYWPSTVAAGLVIIACIAANEDESCNMIAAIHARQKDKDLPDCIKSLQWLMKYL